MDGLFEALNVLLGVVTSDGNLLEEFITFWYTKKKKMVIKNQKSLTLFKVYFSFSIFFFFFSLFLSFFLSLLFFLSINIMSNNIKVVCRFRPQNALEIREGGVPIIEIDEEGTQIELKVTISVLY